MTFRRTVHPLLVEPSYWRDRIEAIVADRQVVWTPRPEDSQGGMTVAEFRIRGHDGQSLWGLFARPSWQKGPFAAIIRCVRPADRPLPSAALVRSGRAEFVFQEPAGRLLRDRVLDVMQICRVALETPDVTAVEVVPARPARGGPAQDELLIAKHLITQHNVVKQWARRGSVRGHLP